ncbi:hypothetical protein [Amycolatopsis sp. cmx-4-61]|uniref:hypothetical protein n=1 Tax=Amycolatopsis sp. cmx-4-61 TaxID=2790937 RepID=UPI00397DEA81
MALTVCHSVVHHDPDAARAALAVLKTQTPEIYRWVLESSRKTVVATPQEVLSRFEAGQNLDGEQVTASLGGLRERADAAYWLVENAVGTETLELAEWSLLNGPDDPLLTAHRRHSSAMPTPSAAAGTARSPCRHTHRDVRACCVRIGHQLARERNGRRG